MRLLWPAGNVLAEQRGRAHASGVERRPSVSRRRPQGPRSVAVNHRHDDGAAAAPLLSAEPPAARRQPPHVAHDIAAQNGHTPTYACTFSIT